MVGRYWVIFLGNIMNRRILVSALMNLLGSKKNEYQIKYCAIKSIIAIKENIRILSILYLYIHVKNID